VRACAACCPITVDPPPDTQPCKFLPAKKKKKKTNLIFCKQKKKKKKNKTKQTKLLCIVPGRGEFDIRKKKISFKIFKKFFAMI
jgi:ERCC4-type nuclease